MSRRIEVELTSRRDDGTWTWRAAGARQPKGELDGGLLPREAKVGDVLRADAEFDLDGILITAVLAPKPARAEKPTIEVLGTRRDEPAVITDWVERKGGSRDKRRGDRDRGAGEGRERGDRRGPRPERSSRPDRPTTSDRPGRQDRPTRPARPPRPTLPPKPKPKRLKPGRAHRQAVLEGVPDEQKPLAEQVLRGGMSEVRKALEKENTDRKAAGQPEIHTAELMALAEQLLPKLRTAKWRDEAEAAVEQVDEVDLRDLRSVVVAADAAARDDETRALAQQLRDALAARVEKEQNAWLGELSELLADGRVVRALRVSSRPPKAGSPLPPEVSSKLVTDTNASLTADTPSDRYATVLDALAYSPVGKQVVPEGKPAEPSEALVAAVRKVGTRLPQIAELFGVAPASRPPRSAEKRLVVPPPPPRPGAALPPPPPAPPAEAESTQ